MIRRFQSADEREKEGRKRGYAGVLEADLWRQEAKFVAHIGEANGNHGEENGAKGANNGAENEIEQEEIPENKKQGLMRWRSGMEERFMDGMDADFPYESVDDGDKFDDWALKDREEEEKWFDEEEAAWADNGQGNNEGIKDAKREEIGDEGLSGQTGVQDL